MGFVREANRDEILEELVESVNIAERVGREVVGPLDSLLERGISLTNRTRSTHRTGWSYYFSQYDWPSCLEDPCATSNGPAREFIRGKSHFIWHLTLQYGVQ